MILKELFTQSEQGFEQQKNYNAEDDISVLDKEDTRKTRLTLKDINKMRHLLVFHKTYILRQWKKD